MKPFRSATSVALFLLAPVFWGASILDSAPALYAQELQVISTSNIAGISLPSGAQRVTGKAVPQEVRDALTEMMKSGGEGVKRGQTEVIAWTGGVSKSRIAEFKKQIATGMKRGGWVYEEGEPLEGAGGATLITASRTSPKRKALVGFYLPDKQTFLLAWTEMLPINAPTTEAKSEGETEQAAPNDTTAETPATVPTSTGDNVLGNLQLPRGAARWNAISAPFTSLLTALAKERIVKQTPQGKAQVWVWKGEAARYDRARFTVSVVESTLTAAGYSVTPINEGELREVNTYEHFDISQGNLPFEPYTGQSMRNVYWKLTHAAKGQALLGVFTQGTEALALGLLPIQYNAPPVAKPLPGLGANAVLIKNFNDVSAALPAVKMPVFAPLQKKPRVVRGWAKDLSGKPLANVEVAVHVSAGGGFRTTHKGRSNAQGLYEVLLPVGVAEVVQADYRMNWNGQTLDRQLAPASASGKFTQFNAQNGHVENLVLKSSDVYGGRVRVLHGLSEGGTIEVTLTSQGARMDGAPARTLVFRYPSGISTGETYFKRIPLGQYTLSAKLLENGETLPLRVRLTSGDMTPKPSLPVKWNSGYNYSADDGGESGLTPFEVSLEP